MKGKKGDFMGRGRILVERKNAIGLDRLDREETAYSLTSDSKLLSL